MASTLATSPVDLISSILQFVDAASIFRLYLCGDNCLNNRLPQSIAQLDLIYDKYLKIRWPALVSRFTVLKSLRVRVLGAPTLPESDYDLSTLPKTLTSLNVPQEMGLFGRPSSREHGVSQDGFWNFSELFPSLKTLVASYNSYQPSTFILLEWIRNLPVSLTELSAKQLVLSPQHVYVLPRSLLSLEVVLRICQQPWDFPPNLLSLTLTCGIPSPQFIKSLPKNLEALVFDTKLGIKLNSSLEELPRSLTALVGLSLKISSPSSLDGLPPNLKRLSLKNASIDNDQCQFPSCLKELIETSAYSLMPISSLNFLPSGLERIEWHNPEIGHPKFWPQYPRSLKSIALRAYLASSEKYVAHLPQNLEEVTLYNPSDSFISHLPTRITSLSMDDRPITFNPSILNVLAQLEHLDLGSGVNVDVKDFQNFKPQLKTLNLRRMLPLYDLDLRLPWAQRLTSFYGGCNAYRLEGNTENSGFKETEEAIEQLKPKPQPLFWWHHFPPSLTSLVLFGRVSYLRASHLHLLPQSLTQITLPNLPIDQDLQTWIPRLPPHLRIVKFEQSYYLRKVCVDLAPAILPPNIQQLHLAKWNQADADALKKSRPWIVLSDPPSK